MEEALTLAPAAACQFKEILGLNAGTHNPRSVRSCSWQSAFLPSNLSSRRTLDASSTLGSVMLVVLPSAWQVHLVWVSVQTPGSSWRHLGASRSLCLPTLITTAQHRRAGPVPCSLPRPPQAPGVVCYLQTPLPPGKSENLKLIFLF